MAPLRSLGNALSSFRDFYASTGTDASGSGGGTPVSATGGTKFTSGSFTYHIYTSSTPAPLSVSAGSEINVLVIGGGAGGQRDGGGGGGAGGVAHAENMPISPGTFTISAGEGKAYHDSPNSVGNSTFIYPSGPTTITGLGGGHGRDSNAGEAGGSGGGGGQPNNSGGAGNQPSQNPGLSYVTNYGNAGGQGSPGDIGGGGGGAGGAGADAPSNGGNGQPFPFMPGPQLYTDMPSPLQSTLGTAWRDALGPTGLMAGGGGGGRNNTAGGAGGPGGGGRGGSPDGATAIGIDYTGSGGGGGGSSPSTFGSDGANGIVVVYYPT